MRSIRRSGVTALTAAIALSLGAVPVAFTAGAFTKAGDPSAVTPAVEPAGPKLVLETNAGVDDWVRQYDANGIEVAPPQSLTEERRCDLGTDNSLLEIGGVVGNSTTDKASFYADSIGVAEKTSGTSCSQVGNATAETLNLGVNSGLRGDVFPLVVSSALLDVELKQSARILATASLGGSPVWTFDLQSGASVGSERPLDVPEAKYTPEVDCLTSADSGPDSKSGDNCMWSLRAENAQGPVVFDMLSLRAAAGSFSLEGGGDWLTPSDKRSVLNLVEYDDGELCFGSSDTRPATSTAPQATVTRVTDAGLSTGAGCIPYRFTNGSNSARFLKDLTSFKQAQFVFDFVWTVDMATKTPAPSAGATASSVSLVPRTTVDYEAGNPLVSISWCPDLVDVVVGDKTFKVVSGIAGNTRAVDQDPTLPDKQFACLVSQATTAVNGDPDKVKIVEQIYVYGDILMRKGG